MIFPPFIPDWMLAMVFGYGTALLIYALVKYKDYTYVAIIPSLIYLVLHYCTTQFVSTEIAALWRGWGYLTLGLSIIIGAIWRLSYFLRSKAWKQP